MSLGTQEIKNLFNLAYCQAFPIEEITADNKILRFNKTWQEVKKEGLLPRLERRFELGLFNGRIVWLKSGADPYGGSKPFTIWRIGLEGDNGLTVLVRGQKTPRIVKKWTKKLNTFFGHNVHLIWEGDLTS